jgi:hypothetical protein
MQQLKGFFNRFLIDSSGHHLEKPTQQTLNKNHQTQKTIKSAQKSPIFIPTSNVDNLNRKNQHPRHTKRHNGPHRSRHTLTNLNTQKNKAENRWWAGRDLDSRPFGYQPNALSHAELPARFPMQFYEYLSCLLKDY